jgi:hypothetical protein
MNILDSPKDWEELNKALWRQSIDPNTREYRPHIAYRGTPEDYENLRTGIQRIGDPSRPDTLEQLAWRERRVIDTFATYAQEHLPTDFTDWEVILLGQHYRLPTRLLDWTASPYVALFFATEDLATLDRDGIVWCVSRIDTISALPSPFDAYLAEQSGKLFSLQTLRKHFSGLPALDECSRDALLWFEPPSLSPRIVNQYAYFSIMPGVDNQQSVWFEKHPEWHWGVPVPARLKKDVRRRLQVMNITERMIYTGLEGIAKWIRTYYSA